MPLLQALFCVKIFSGQTKHYVVHFSGKSQTPKQSEKQPKAIKIEPEEKEDEEEVEAKFSDDSCNGEHSSETGAQNEQNEVKSDREESGNGLVEDDVEDEEHPGLEDDGSRSGVPSDDERQNEEEEEEDEDGSGNEEDKNFIDDCLEEDDEDDENDASGSTPSYRSQGVDDEDAAGGENESMEVEEDDVGGIIDLDRSELSETTGEHESSGIKTEDVEEEADK